MSQAIVQEPEATEELHFNVRLEGETTFTSAGGGAVADIRVTTIVLIEAGKSSWADNPFRAKVITEFRGADSDDQCEEVQFPSSEELCTWLEKSITDLQAKGFTTVRYKANGLPIDWLNRINLPPN